ncbi:MAG: RNA polymerase II mediator complex subunit [Bathelium mastoideum]|nr:MAG: RNA polymerase II mediator complex subunit [Bathelium mastoideum]
MTQSETQSPSFPLSLRPWPTNETEESLKVVISRVFESRGHFKDISEQSLLDEIQAEQASKSQTRSDLDHVDESKDELDPKARLEKIYATKAEMWQSLSQAHQEVLMVQDLVSLLLRKETDLPLPPSNPMLPGPEKDKKKKGAEKSMTEYVLNNTPLRALGFKEASPGTELLASDGKREDEEAISQGHRMKGLCKSADNLLAAARRLKKEVEKETNYWNQILTIRETGWSITRLPKEQHNLAVRFGFSEAAGNFKHRGLAALRAGESGNIVLDETLTSATKSIRVCIVENGKVVGSSRLPLMDAGPGAPIQDLIRSARDTLFDEELFQELTRESRLLLPHKVTMHGGKIHIPVYQSAAHDWTGSTSTREVVLDLIGDDETSTMDRGPGDTEAQGIALALRVLLSYTHRQRLHSRTQVPLPIDDRRHKEPTPPLIRVLMGYLQHKTGLDNIRSLLQRRMLLLKQGGLSLNFTAKSTSPNISTWLSQYRESDAVGHNIQASCFESFVSLLCAPLETTVTFGMGDEAATSGSEIASIRLQSHLSTPLLGTNVALRLPDPRIRREGTPDTDSYDSLDDLMTTVTHAICSHLVQTITSEHDGWNTSPGGNEATKGGSGPNDQQKRLVVSMDDKSLNIALSKVGENNVWRHSWTTDQDIPDNKTFADVVADLSLS